MSLAQVISGYLSLNLLLLIGFGFLWLLPNKNTISYSSLLRLNYITIALILALSLLQGLLPKNKIFEPAAKIWSAQSFKSFSHDYDHKSNAGFLNISSATNNFVVSSDRVVLTWLLLAGLILLWGVENLRKDLRRIFAIQRQSFLIRKYRRVHIYSNDSIGVPFSFLTPRYATVILPSKMAANSVHLRIAIAHELQHHRQGDTIWIYALWSLRLLCCWNPIVYSWSRTILELQEFACDEALLSQKKVDSLAYARCLIEVAQSSLHQERVPVCATGLTFLVERNLIKRRVKTMLKPSNQKMKPGLTISICATLAALLVTTAYAAKALVQDRRIDFRQAQEMVATAKKSSSFPIVLNDQVLAQLNKYIGTPEGREFMRSALRRLESHRALVLGKIQSYNLPEELMAVPIIESGYENLAESNRAGRGAGIWMFIKSTAINFGLVVNEKVDERLNVELLTDAAMRYLQSNFLRFKDWQLAVLAYNIGESSVQKGIHQTGSRDAWVLIQNGYENDPSYLPKLMAAILIMKNPDSVN